MGERGRAFVIPDLTVKAQTAKLVELIGQPKGV